MVALESNPTIRGEALQLRNIRLVLVIGEDRGSIYIKMLFAFRSFKMNASIISINPIADGREHSSLPGLEVQQVFKLGLFVDPISVLPAVTRVLKNRDGGISSL